MPSSKMSLSSQASLRPGSSCCSSSNSTTSSSVDSPSESADSGRDSTEDEVVELDEDQQEDPSLILGCDNDNDIFDDGISDSQLKRAVDAPTQEDPEGPVQSPKVVELPPPEPLEVIESEQDLAPLRDRQDIGLEDPSLSPHSVEELPLGQEDSRQEVEQRSN